MSFFVFDFSPPPTSCLFLLSFLCVCPCRILPCGLHKFQFQQQRGLQLQTNCWLFFPSVFALILNEFPVLFSFFSFFMFSFLFLIFSFVPKTCHPCVLWCGWPCSVPRMPFSPLTGRETKITSTKIGKISPHTDLDRPPPSLPKTNLLEKKKLTQQTPAKAVYKSGQERSGQVRKCRFDSSVVQFAEKRLENSGALEGRKRHVARSGILS